ncbi:MAG: DNA alkylation repair protein [Patescibacteria group bacterium]|jgi:3-methyladenine DNA glycosylase AlkD|nr:DNA alkylation repair protein [Patescibacteria group bacterium]
MTTVSSLKEELKKLSNPKTKKVVENFFKTAVGEYGEGDIFLGIKTPDLRKTAKKYADLSFPELQELFDSEIHDHRAIVLVILCDKLKKSSDIEKKEIYNFYLDNTRNINNWDLVDISAPNIVGTYLGGKDRKTLYKLARSKDLWERRIAIVSTFSFIRNNDFFDTLTISELLLNDDKDLIHKACGWMLREVGKRDEKTLKLFLDKFKNQMPRVMLRYAIEKFPDKIRKEYLKK